MAGGGRMNAAVIALAVGCAVVLGVWVFFTSGPDDVTAEYQEWSAAHQQSPGAEYAGFVSDVSLNEEHSSYTFTTRLPVGDSRAVDLCTSFRVWAEQREVARKGRPDLRLFVLNNAGETASHAAGDEACQRG